MKKANKLKTYLTVLIPLSLILITFWACSNSTTEEDKRSNEHKIGNNAFSSIPFVDGHYQIDKTKILSNQNLQSLMGDLEKAELTEKSRVNEIPYFIKTFLDNLTGNFTIANPDENWQVGCVAMGKLIEKKVYDKKTGDTLIELTFDNSHPLPSRQLIYFGLGKDIALLTYYTGGIAQSEHILIIKFQDNEIINLWWDYISGDVKNKTEVLKYLKENKNNNKQIPP